MSTSSENPLSRLGFGCVALTTLPSQSAAVRLLHAVHDAGITHFDTAPIYGSGYSELILGKFLRETRSPVTVATKFGLGRPAPKIPAALALPLHALRRNWRGAAVSSSASASPCGNGENAAPTPVLPPRLITRAAVEHSFNVSRRALGRARLDYFLLHEGLPGFLEPAAWEFLQAARHAGDIGALGVAAGGRNYHRLSATDFAGWDLLQYEFGPAWPENASLPARFPQLAHNFHSCLKDYARHGAPGEILARCVAANPGGRVLFSTRTLGHLASNLRALTSPAR